MNKEAEAEVSATAKLSPQGDMYTLPVSIRYALNAENLNLKLFVAVLENGLVSYQKNAFSSIADPDLGEWGKGGRYGSATVSPYTFDHVVRGWEGATFTGTAELLPTEFIAGENYVSELEFEVPATVSHPENTELVVMLFDGNTDRLINACKAGLDTPEGIDGVEASAPVRIVPLSGGVQVNTAEAATVQLFAADGRLLRTATTAGGTLTLRCPGYKGVAVVKVTTAQGVEVQKAQL